MGASPTYPPNGFDRSDGNTTFNGQTIGTPTPAGSRKVTPSATWLQEDPASPELERGEQFTLRHTINCDPDTGQTLIQGIGRGTTFQDSLGLISRVVQSSLVRQSGDKSVFTFTAEGINSDVPPDKYEVDAMELNPPLIRHPRYVGLLFYQPIPGQMNGIQIINAIETAISGANTFAQAENITSIQNITDPNVQGYAKEYAAKRYRGEDTWYLPVFQVTWKQFSYTPTFDVANPGINPGGYIEDPVLNGGLPAFFWSSTQLPGGDNLLTKLAGQKSPMFFGNGLSWLRKSDRLNFDRTLFDITRTWLGAPNGNSTLSGFNFSYWDPEIYSSQITPPNTNLFP